jgi:hypothetical protein
LNGNAVRFVIWSAGCLSKSCRARRHPTGEPSDHADNQNSAPRVLQLSAVELPTCPRASGGWAGSKKDGPRPFLGVGGWEADRSGARSRRTLYLRAARWESGQESTAVVLLETSPNEPCFIKPNQRCVCEHGCDPRRISAENNGETKLTTRWLGYPVRLVCSAN